MKSPRRRNTYVCVTSPGAKKTDIIKLKLSDWSNNGNGGYYGLRQILWAFLTYLV